MKNQRIRVLLLTVVLAGAMAFSGMNVHAAATNRVMDGNSQEIGTGEETEVEPEEPIEPEEPEVPQEVITPMYVGVRSVTLYAEPDTASLSISVPYREAILVTDVGEVSQTGKEFTKVYYQEQTYYITTTSQAKNLVSSVQEPSFQGNTIYQQKFLDVVKDIWQNWDTKYAHNSSNGIPDENGVYGFDCSGLVAYAANTAMQPFVPAYRLSRSIIDLYNVQTVFNKDTEYEFSATTVCTQTYDESKLQPGDVLFFNLYTEEDGTQSAKGYNHCGIYIGNGEMVHSSHSFGGSVRIMPLSGIYEKNFVCARRYMPEKIHTINKMQYTILTSTKIYSERSTSSKVTVYAPIESPVELLFTSNGTWGYVRLGDGKQGFVLLRNLCDNIAERKITCYVRVSSAKLCKTLTIKKDYTWITKGAKVQYVGRVGASNYYEVIYEGQTYYIYSKNGIKDKLSTAVVYPDAA